MRGRLRRVVAAAALTAAAVAGSTVAAGPASADPANPGCYEDHICFYQDVNFNNWNRDSSGWRFVHVGVFANCNWFHNSTAFVNGITSVYNNTDAHIELWDVHATPDDRVGTAVRRKGYTFLEGGNDKTDVAHAVGCH